MARSYAPGIVRHSSRRPRGVPLDTSTDSRRRGLLKGGSAAIAAAFAGPVAARAALGRFSHEASALDLATGGTLWGLAVRGLPDAFGITLASTLGDVVASGPCAQAYQNGAAIFGANEGCWVAGGICCFTDKATGTNANLYCGATLAITGPFANVTL